MTDRKRINHHLHVYSIPEFSRMRALFKKIKTKFKTYCEPVIIDTIKPFTVNLSKY